MKKVIWALVLLLSSCVSANTYIVTIQNEQTDVAILKIKTQGDINLQQAAIDVHYEVEFDLSYDPDSFPHNGADSLPLQTAIPVLLDHLNNVNSEGSLCVGEVYEHGASPGPPPLLPSSWDQDSMNATIPLVATELGYGLVTQPTQALYTGQVPPAYILTLPVLGSVGGTFLPIRNDDNTGCKKTKDGVHRYVDRGGQKVYPCLFNGCDQDFQNHYYRSLHHANGHCSDLVLSEGKYTCPNCGRRGFAKTNNLLMHMSRCKGKDK